MPQALVIDDSGVIRTLLTEILDEWGFSVQAAEHGADGLAQLNDGLQPDLVLVDWNMPVMNGLEFVQAVRAHPRLHGLTVIMVTTENDLAHMEAAISAGVNEFIMKPIDKVAMYEKLRFTGKVA